MLILKGLVSIIGECFIFKVVYGENMSESNEKEYPNFVEIKNLNHFMFSFMKHIHWAGFAIVDIYENESSTDHRLTEHLKGTFKYADCEVEDKIIEDACENLRLFTHNKKSILSLYKIEMENLIYHPQYTGDINALNKDFELPRCDLKVKLLLKDIQLILKDIDRPGLPFRKHRKFYKDSMIELLVKVNYLFSFKDEYDEMHCAFNRFHFQGTDEEKALCNRIQEYYYNQNYL
jgi:hypothetical protein